MSSRNCKARSSRDGLILLQHKKLHMQLYLTHRKYLLYAEKIKVNHPSIRVAKQYKPDVHK